MHSALWWRDFEFQDGMVTVKKTGARLRVEPGLIGEVLAWFPFYFTVEAWRLGGMSRPDSARAPRIWFTPDRPRPWYLVWSVLHAAGARIADSPETADAVFVFDDSTVCSPVQAQPGTRLVNAGCQSIAKGHVARVFEQVFGYSLALDPESWHGAMVEKSETNGVHDGRIVEGPRPARHGYVYQRLIDNRAGDGMVEDLRCPTVDGRIPIVMRKRRRIGQRFENTNHEVEVAETGDVFTPDEQAQLSRFMLAMRLDWGGLDVLRDRRDGRIYVVDVNKTDMGPPIALSLDDKIQGTRRMARALTDYTQRVLSGDHAPCRHNPD